MRDVYVAGVGMTRFGKFLDKTLKDLAREAVWEAIRDAEIDPRKIAVAYAANSYAGLITGQETVRGQTLLRACGITKIPVINVENACASGSTAFNQAWLAVASGLYDVALALGVEKLYCGDLGKSLHALSTSSDVEIEGKMGIFFPGIYALRVKEHMAKYGITKEQLARVAVKNHFNGSLNPRAQYRNTVTVEEVLTSRVIVDPITLLMTAPIGDGAAAAILVGGEAVKNLRKPKVKVLATCLVSNDPLVEEEGREPTVTRAARAAFEAASVDPKDVGVVELHDVVAPVEMLLWEQTLICPPGESGKWVDEGVVELTGRVASNTSGGLCAKGHPAAATGLAQVAEIVWQLRGEAGQRQVQHKPLVGMVENGGGNVANDTAAVAIHLLGR